MRCHGTKCPLLTAFLSLSLLISPLVTSLGFETLHGLLIHKNIGIPLKILGTAPPPLLGLLRGLGEIF